MATHAPTAVGVTSGATPRHIVLPDAEYTQYTHRGSKFDMRVPRRGVPWEGGWIEYLSGDMYDSECRCGVIRRAVFFSDDGRRGPVVALKILDRKRVAKALDSWESEVAMMAKLQPRGLLSRRACPQMPRWDRRAVPGEPNVYIATEWAAGGTLQAWAARHVRDLRARNMFSVWFERVLPRLATQLLEGLAHMHRCGRGVVHLDLDPVNIVMTSPDLETAELMFIDFGSAREVDAAGRVGDDGIKWKFSFCAPEIHRFWAHQIDSFDGRAADVFSAAAILWWLVALPPACLFDDMQSSHIVDVQKHWLSNLMRHAEGLHDEQARERVHRAMAQAQAEAAAALHEATAVRAALDAARAHAHAHAHAPTPASTAPTPAARVAVLEAQLRAAEERVRTTQLCCAELREGRRVVLPFQTGECLCCRWGFKIPPQWCSLLVYVLFRDRTPAHVALAHLQRDVHRRHLPAPPAAAAAAAAAKAAATTTTAAVPSPSRASHASEGDLPRGVAESVLQSSSGLAARAAHQEASQVGGGAVTSARQTTVVAAASGVWSKRSGELQQAPTPTPTPMRSSTATPPAAVVAVPPPVPLLPQRSYMSLGVSLNDLSTGSLLTGYFASPPPAHGGAGTESASSEGSLLGLSPTAADAFAVSASGAGAGAGPGVAAGAGTGAGAGAGAGVGAQGTAYAQDRQGHGQGQLKQGGASVTGAKRLAPSRSDSPSNAGAKLSPARVRRRTRYSVRRPARAVRQSSKTSTASLSSLMSFERGTGGASDAVRHAPLHHHAAAGSSGGGAARSSAAAGAGRSGPMASATDGADAHGTHPLDSLLSMSSGGSASGGSVKSTSSVFSSWTVDGTPDDAAGTPSAAVPQPPHVARLVSDASMMPDAA